MSYSIGLDFGTLAGRAVLVDNATGREVAVSVYGYQDAIIDTVLPGSDTRLPADFALQNPRDYMEAAVSLLKDVLQRSGVPAEQVTGIGVDTTASTVLPLDRSNRPLCLDPAFRADPHSWIKMWKHHSPQPQADRLNRIAAERGEPFLSRCGGKISAEWYWPKVLETLEKSPAVFDAAAHFTELGDWMVYLLTGTLCRSSAVAALHAQWDAAQGDLPADFLNAVHPRLAEALNKTAPVCPIFSRAGGLTPQMAAETGLLPGTAVSAAQTDSPIALLSLGVTEPETAALILGTSSVFMLAGREGRQVPGAMACVKDQMLPGCWGHMFGQSAVGDSFEWFVKNLAPAEVTREAAQNGETVFDVMNRRMAALDPAGEHPVALDWFNGSRSLQNASLTGVVVGMTLSTRPEHIYRSLVEATAFGLKKIIAEAEAAGVPVKKIRACGGLPRKSPEIMQLYADILELPIETVASREANGCGSAALGALAAGSAHGGFDTVEEAVRHMRLEKLADYRPNESLAPLYRRLYARYEQLYRFFSEQQPGLMPELKCPQNSI